MEEHLDGHQQNLHEKLAALPALETAEELLRLADADLTCEAVRVSTVIREPDPWQTIATPPSADRACRYNVLRPLGKGGLGIVSVALDEELHREVALKEIQPRLADNTESRLRFVREAEITGGLEHPGIVPVYGLGTYSDGRLFYAMQLIRGESLRAATEQCFRAEAAGLRKLLTRFIQACEAVAYAHSRQVVHRDIKPDNIMLGRYGETLVVDWGLAKSLQHARQGSEEAREEPFSAAPAGPCCVSEGPLRLSSQSSSDATQMGSMLGTPQFMSPEQAEGRLDRVGPASDIYSLGATLYFVITGQAPFESADVHEVLACVRRGDFRRPREVRRGVPPALEAVCMKAMSHDPRDRYATAGELAEEVERWLGDEPVRAYAEPWGQRVLRWSRRHRAWTLAGGMALVLVTFTAVVAAIVVGRAWQHEQFEHEQTLQARREADAARHAAELAQTELAKQITLLGLEEQLRQSVQSKPLLWEIAADRIEPLYQRHRVPTSKDTSMQTWSLYRAEKSDRLAGRTTIYLAPIGFLGEQQLEQARVTGEFLSRFFDLPVKVLPPAPIKWPTPSEAVDCLSALQRPADAAALLGITSVELGDTMQRAVDTQGDVQRQSTLISIAADSNPQALRRRLKLAVAAVAEAFGMADFAAYHCGLNPVHSLADLDDKPLPFCPECEQKVWWLSDVEPLERYKRLVEFAHQHHLEQERRHWQRSLDAIHTPKAQP